MEKLAFDVFQFSSFRAFFSQLAGPKTQRSGFKTQLATALNVQPSFVSGIINESQHISLEHAFKLSMFLKFDAEERDYLLTLVQIERAGTSELKAHWQSYAKTLTERRMSVVGRLGKKESLNEEDRSTYYSTWEYAAVHIAMTIPHLRSLQALEQQLRIPQSRLIEVIRFLEKSGLVKMKNGAVQEVSYFQRIGKDSPLIFQHHTNWRVKAIESLPRESAADLHYSGTFSLSVKDAAKIKDDLLEVLKKHQALMKDSKEDELWVYNIDWFKI